MLIVKSLKNAWNRENRGTVVTSVIGSEARQSLPVPARLLRASQ
jgi:hypothetical protein